MDASSTPPKSAVTTAAPPRTQNGRAIFPAELKVSVARAAKRPTSAEPQGRASRTANRNRTGQTSRVAASSVNDALPPCSCTPVRQAWCPASTSAGDQTDGRSRPAIANNATPGMTPGATPTNDSAPTWAPKLTRLRDSVRAVAAIASCTFPVGPGQGGLGPGLAGDPTAASDLLASDLLAASVTELAAGAVGTAPTFAVLALTRVSTDAGSRVTAMIKATASEASVQLRAGTWRIEGFVPELVSVTSAATAPDAARPIRTRIESPLLSSTNRTRGERARTRSIRSSRFVQLGSASSSRCAAATAALGSAAATRSRAAKANAASRNDVRRALVLINAHGNIAQWN